MREQFTVWIDDESWSVERYDPYQNYLCETERDDPPFSCKNVAVYELVRNSDEPMADPDASGRLYLCEECLEKINKENQ